VIDFYPDIRLAHILSVITSGSLYCLRGLAVSAGRADWALARGIRRLSYAIDTTLLATALMLVAILPGAAFANGWLAAKLVLLPVYIVLAWFSLRRPAGGARQVAFFAGALVAYGLMITIARTHDPLGPLHALAGYFR